MQADVQSIDFTHKSSESGASLSAHALRQALATMSTSPNPVNNLPQRRYQFIDNNDTSSTKHNSTRVRRHVMQEHMRDKRWKSRTKTDIHEEGPHSQTSQSTPELAKTAPKKPRHQKHQSDSSASLGIITFDSQMPIVARSESQHEEVLNSNMGSSQPTLNLLPVADPEKLVDDSKPELVDTVKSFAVLAELYPYEPPSPSHTITSGSSLSTPGSLRGHVSPISFLSAARTDPFDVLPMSLTVRDQELFDFYATVMPSCSYGFERRNPRAHNWYRDVFIPEAMKGAVTFQNTILVHAANTQAWVLGLTETRLSLEHRIRSSSILSKFYQLHPDATSDAIITATMSAAALEDFDPRKDRKPIAWMHWGAAMHKIRERGGPAVLESTSSLRKLVNWQDYIFSGYDGRGSSFFFTPEAMLLNASRNAKEAYGRQEILSQCEEFLAFLKRAERVASAAVAQLEIPASRSRPYQSLRYSVFMPGHPLYTLLASPNKGRYTDSGQLKQTISRLAALMTINVVMWEYRHHAWLIEAFLQELSDNIMNNELHKNISVEALLQILLSGNDSPALWNVDRPWYVGRLLKVAKRLSRGSWERLNDFLLSCLTIEPEARSRTQINSWEKALRGEILGAPLVSYELPLMQTKAP